MKSKLFSAICMLMLISILDSTHLTRPIKAQTGVTPLPGGCTGVLPPGEPEAACCIIGFVYIEGEVVAGAEVTIESANGRVNLVTQVYAGAESRPHYKVSLSSAPLGVEAGDTITLTALYSGHEEILSYVVQEGGQQVDIIISQNGITDYAPNWDYWVQAELGEFNLPEHMALDSLGNIYVVDRGNARVQVFDIHGTLLRQWGIFGNQDGQFVRPAGIAIDSNDNVYVSDGETDQITKFTSSGHNLTQWGSYGDGNGQFDGPNALVLDSFDNLYVLDAGNHRIQKFDANGQYLAQWGSQGNGVGQFNYPFGMAIDSDGNLYVSDSKNHRIQKFDANGLYLTQWGGWGSAVGQFSETRGIAVDNDNYVYVTDVGNDRIQKFSSDGTFISQWGEFGDGDGQFNFPFGIIIDNNGNVYVSDFNDRVQKFNNEGLYLDQWGRRGGVDTGKLHFPLGLAISNNGEIFVVERYNDRVSRFDYDGNYLGSWGSTGSGNGQFISPEDIAINGELVYVVDWGNNRIQMFDLNGNYLSQWGGFGSENGQFDRPEGIAVDNNGNIYVTDWGNHRIQIFDGTGNYLNQWGDFGSSAGQFYWPMKIKVDHDGNVYVTEWGNHRVQKFDSVGTYLNQWGELGGGNGQFFYPGDIAIDAQNQVWIADTGNSRMQVFSTDGAYLTQWGKSGDYQHVPFFMSFDNSGNLIMTNYSFQLLKLSSMTYTQPIATINHFSADASNLNPSEDILMVHGMGADSDETNSIVSYRWTSNKDGILAEGPSAALEIPAQDLSSGTHYLTLEVQDDEGEWSEPVTAYDRVYVAYTVPPPPPPPGGGTAGQWTFLLYLDGDNTDINPTQLVDHFNDAITRLRQAGDNPYVQIALQLDGPSSIYTSTHDTRRLIFRPGEEPVEIDYEEQAIDDPDRLADFIRWGQAELPGDYYYLAISDHGQGIQGIGWDYTTDFRDDGSIQDDKYLTDAEIASALTAPDVAPINVLHLDGCSMNLIEVAFELRGAADFLLTSQNLAWSYFTYDEYMQTITATTTPAQFAVSVTETYAAKASADNLPFTIAALNLARSEAVKVGLDYLALQLEAWVEMDPAINLPVLNDIRSQSQKFEFNGDSAINDLDDYVDLQDWATHIYNANLNSAINAWASLLLVELNGVPNTIPFILANEKESGFLLDGNYYDLTNAHGVSVYYPESEIIPIPPPPSLRLAPDEVADFSVAYDDYINNRLFEFTLASRWDEFLRVAVGVPEPGDALAPPPGPLPHLNPPPPAPILRRPLDGGYVTKSHPRLRWYSVSESVSYEIQLDNSPTFLVAPINVDHKEFYRPSAPLAEGFYYWRVRAIDETGVASVWSETRSFAVSFTRPPSPILVSPKNKAVLSDNTPTFTWESAGSGYAYELQVYGIRGSTLMLDVKVDENVLNYTLENALTRGIYRWRVRAINQWGRPGAWSQVRKFALHIEH